MHSTALITGITGQDGAYLAQLLLGKGYRVVGTFNPAHTCNTSRLEQLGIRDRVDLVPLDIGSTDDTMALLANSRPNEVYHLAAQSSVRRSFDIPLATGEISGLGTARILEALRRHAPEARFYQASSSEIFGRIDGAPQDEAASYRPRSPYAIAKLYAHLMTVNYREAYGMHASAGILFNHESPLRPTTFVTRKITMGAAQIKAGTLDRLHLGNLDAERDWGFAKEYVDAMWRMTQQDEPGDYVIATGRCHSVRDFAAAAFAAVDLDWRDYVTVDESLTRPTDVDRIVGQPAKAARELGWHAETSFAELVQLMVDHDVALVERGNADEVPA